MKNTDGKQRFAKSLQAIGLAVVFLLVASPGGSFGQTPARSQHSAVPPPATAIAPEEVAARASEVTNFVITFSEKFAVSPEIEKIQQALPEISKQIDLDAAETAATIGAQPSLAILETQRALWQRWQLQVSTWLTLLTRRAVELRRDLDRLAQMKATWTRTRDVAQAGQAPGVVLQQIEATLSSIEAAQLPLKAREEAVLGLQADMAAKQARCDHKLAQILKARQVRLSMALPRGKACLSGAPTSGVHARTTLPHRLGDIARGFQTSFRQYIRDPSRGLPLHMALLLVLTMATCAARRKKRQWKDSGVGVSQIVKVFDHPYSASLILVLLVATAVDSPAPAHVKCILAALAIIPMIRLVRPVIDPRFAPMVFTAVILYAIDLVRQAFGDAPWWSKRSSYLKAWRRSLCWDGCCILDACGITPNRNSNSLGARWLPLLTQSCSCSA